MAAAANVGLPWYEAIEGDIWNAATGTLTQAQKNNLIAQQASGVAGAGGNPASASSQATADVTAVLTANNADPSQASIFNDPGLDSLFQKAGWVIAILAGLAFLYFGFQAYHAFKG